MDPAAVQPCDRLAAAPEDTSRNATVRGIKLEEIKTGDAIAACSEAVKEFPGVDRFHYQLGRALFAVRDYPAALASYKKAFELGCKGLTTFNPEGKRMTLLKKSSAPKPVVITPVQQDKNEDMYNLALATAGEACTFDPATGRKSCE
jgi:tetratricopeptide (TPR) repeat protein